MAKRIPSFCLLSLLFWPAFAQAGALSVKRVVDGDTLLLSDGRRVRLIGIDTPEVHESEKLERTARRNKRDTKTIQALGRRAAHFVNELMPGRAVRLEFDQHNKIHQNKDPYGRTLAYVYFTPPACDDISPDIAEQVCELNSFEKGFLNALVVEAGYADVFVKAPFKFKEDFLQLRREAREKKRGLWKDAGPLTRLFDYDVFRAEITTNTQPARNASPPSGVIAPSQRTPLMLNA